MCQENLDRILLVSTGFFFMFAAFNTAQNLTTKVMEDNHFGKLGYYSLAVHYFFFGICSFISAPIVTKLGPRLSMLFGATTYSIFIAAFILPIERNDHPDNKTLEGMKGFIYGLLIFVAALNGIGASIIWVAQGKYLSECANERNKGLYMSIFQAFMQMCLIFCNVIGAFLIDSVPLTTFYIVLTGLVCLSALLFLFLRKPIP